MLDLNALNMLDQSTRVTLAYAIMILTPLAFLVANYMLKRHKPIKRSRRSFYQHGQVRRLNRWEKVLATLRII